MIHVIFNFFLMKGNKEILMRKIFMKIYALFKEIVI